MDWTSILVIVVLIVDAIIYFIAFLYFCTYISYVTKSPSYDDPRRITLYNWGIFFIILLSIRVIFSFASLFTASSTNEMAYVAISLVLNIIVLIIFIGMNRVLVYPPYIYKEGLLASQPMYMPLLIFAWIFLFITLLTWIGELILAIYAIVYVSRGGTINNS